MDASTETLRRERIDAIQELAAAHLSAEQRSLIDGFAREYFRQLDTDDLTERTPEDLCGAVLSHWQFGATRTPGRPTWRRLDPG